MRFAVNIRADLPKPPVRTWEGYRNPVGARNLLGIQTTVQCAAGVVNAAVGERTIAKQGGRTVPLYSGRGERTEKAVFRAIRLGQ